MTSPAFTQGEALILQDTLKVTYVRSKGDGTSIVAFGEHATQVVSDLQLRRGEREEVDYS